MACNLTGVRSWAALADQVKGRRHQCGTSSAYARSLSQVRVDPGLVARDAHPIAMPRTLTHLEIVRYSTGYAVRLALTGEVDVQSGAPLERAIHDAVTDQATRALTVDLDEVTFLDSIGS